MFIFRAPSILSRLYPKSIWRKESTKAELYLTFDDGPIPELTPWVLDVLKQYNIKATFFCVGQNISKNPEIFDRILKEGHQVGNHTYNHLKGWKSSNEKYIDNVKKCQELTNTNLFRPPYGRITKKQFKLLSIDYDVVFWDVLTHDYDQRLKPEKCFKNAVKYTRNGSVIVFHDNIKAEKNLKYTLPLYIEYFLKLNYKFATL